VRVAAAGPATPAQFSPKDQLENLSPDSIESLRRSEKIAEDCLRYLNGLDLSDIDVEQTTSEIRKGTWIGDYRFAEAFSDKLAGLLDKYLQIWLSVSLKEHHKEHKSPDRSFGSSEFVRSPLQFCAAFGFGCLGKAFLQMGYNPNLIAYPSGQSPLHLSSAGGYCEFNRILLARGADLEARTATTGRTPLQIAAFRGRGEVVRQLVELGADINAKDNFECTAMDIASASGYGHIASFLLGLQLAKLSMTGNGSVRSQQVLHDRKYSLRVRTAEKHGPYSGARARRAARGNFPCSSSFHDISQTSPDEESSGSGIGTCADCGHTPHDNCDEDSADDWGEVSSDDCDESP
jgi:hypothetical protein